MPGYFGPGNMLVSRMGGNACFSRPLHSGGERYLLSGGDGAGVRSHPGFAKKVQVLVPFSLILFLVEELKPGAE